jgi:hypothetical protein
VLSLLVQAQSTEQPTQEEIMTAPAIKRPVAKGPAAPPVAKKATAPAKAATPAKAAPAKKDDGKLSAKGLSCLCGCGQATLTDSARFIPGHDAKLKSVLLKVERGELTEPSIPKIARPFLQKSKMSGAWSFPTESGNTPDEDKFGKTWEDRKDEVEAAKAEKKAKPQAKLAELKAKKAKGKAKPKAKPVEVEDEEEEDEEEEE